MDKATRLGVFQLKGAARAKALRGGGSLKKGQRGGIGGASGNCGVSKAVVPAEAC